MITWNAERTFEMAGYLRKLQIRDKLWNRGVENRPTRKIVHVMLEHSAFLPFRRVKRLASAKLCNLHLEVPRTFNG